ncbi:MAG: NACHT domain-containing protein, partial [bacterium]|nr:NACHT domain-containing protein [bacterium]
KMKLIRYNFEMEGYTIVVKECVGLIEHALRQLFSQYLTQLNEQDRLNVQKAETEIGKGQRGIERFTLGELVGVFRMSHFLDAWARTSGKNLNSLRVINFHELTTLRNKFIHGEMEATRSEAEFLLNCLQVILETFGIEDFEAVEENSTPFTHPLPLPGGASSLVASRQKPYASRDQRDRYIMLDRVKTFWVKGVLEKSVHNAASIELGKQKQPEAVAHPWEMVLETPDHQSRPIPPGKPIIESFDEIGRALLILGAPGSGKTTTLLELARDAIVRAENDPTHFIPVIFNLSSWTDPRQNLADWLEEEFNLKYQIPKKIAQQWIENHELLLLLDGLDEVKPANRAACVEAINRFRREHGLNDIVICCRTQEYEAFSTRLKLEGALMLQALSLEQVDDYLAAAGPELAALRTVMQKDAAFQKLAESPLMLSIMALAYQGASVEELSSSDSVEECRKRLFETYTEVMLKRKGGGKRYSPQQTRHWLACLARKMSQHSQTEFFIENMQPTWLSSSSQRLLYDLGVRSIGGLGLVLTAVLSYAPAVVVSYLLLVVGAMLSGGMANALTTLTSGPFGVPDLRFMYMVYVGLMLALAFGVTSVLAVRLPVWSAIGVAMGTVALLVSWYLRDGDGWKYFGGMALALIFGLPGGLAAMSLAERNTIQIAETLSWSWKRAFRGLAAGLILLLLGILLWLAAGHFNILLSDVLGAGLPIAVALVVMSGLTRSELIEKRTLPNQGIRRSASNAVRVGFVVLVLSMLFSLAFAILNSKDTLAEGVAAGLILGLLIAFVLGLFVGGAACIQHLVLYRLLVRDGQIPRDLVDFLDHAAECIFLRKVGGGYIFIHKMLSDYFSMQEELQEER